MDIAYLGAHLADGEFAVPEPQDRTLLAQMVHITEALLH